MRFIFIPLTLVCALVHSAKAVRADERADAAVDRLITAARLYDEKEMRASVDTLATIGRAAVPALIAALDDADDNVRWQAIVAVARIGRDDGRRAIPALHAALDDIDPDVRGVAAETLGVFGADQADIIRRICQLRDDEHPKVRAHAHWAIWQLTRSADTIPALAQLLGDKDWMAGAAAERHLGQIGAAAAPTLAAYVSKKSNADRYRAITALGQLPADSIIAQKTVHAALADQDPLVVQAAVVATGRLGAPALPALLRALRDKNCGYMPAVLRAVAAIGAPARPAEAGVVPFLVADDRGVQLGAIGALAQIPARSPAAVAGLVDLLESSDEDLRGAAVEALGKIGAPAAVAAAALRRLAQKDRAEFVRLAAGDALDRIAEE